MLCTLDLLTFEDKNLWQFPRKKISGWWFQESSPFSSGKWTTIPLPLVWSSFTSIWWGTCTISTRGSRTASLAVIISSIWWTISPTIIATLNVYQPKSVGRQVIQDYWRTWSLDDSKQIQTSMIMRKLIGSDVNIHLYFRYSLQIYASKRNFV